MSWTLSAESDEQWPGYSTGSKRLRGSEATGAGRLLLAAAALCLSRAAIVPWLMKVSAPTTTGPTDEEIVCTSLILMAVFAISGMWARFSPLLATTFAVGLFTGLCVRDFMTYKDLFDAGLLSKIALALLLLRGLMNAVVSKTI